MLVVFGWVTNDHKFSSFTQHTCLTRAPGSQDGVQSHSLAGPSVPGLTGCRRRVGQAVVSSGGSTWEETLPRSLRILVESIAMVV